MTDLGCPFGAGPACADCDGSCWEPQVLHTWAPEPCEGCHYITGRMQVCDGTCDGLTEDNAEQRRAEYDAAHPKTPDASQGAGSTTAA